MLLHAIAFTCMAAAAAPAPTDYFAIKVVDDQTGRGVPLVELETTNNVKYYTDSNGLLAFYEPGLMDQKVFFTVKSHGYEFPKDGFGIPGRQLDVKPGGSVELKIKRINIAERLYRMTGGGIYRDTVMLGKKPPTTQPVLNAKVFGQDSVMNSIYGGKLYWFWGDTGWPQYPLGNFDISGATSLLPGQGGLDPEVGVDLGYFQREDGFVRPMAKVGGKGPTWTAAPVVLRPPPSPPYQGGASSESPPSQGGASSQSPPSQGEAKGGRERMFSAYAKIEGANMRTYARGMTEWNDEKQEFVKVAEWPMDWPVVPSGHTMLATEDGVQYAYHTTPFPVVRVRATPEAIIDIKQYEAFTCLKEGTRLTSIPQKEGPALSDGEIDRDEQGRVRYSWKRNTPPVNLQEQAGLIKLGKLKPEEGLLHLQDVDTGKPVMAHGGTICWNEYRKRWIMIVCEIFGTSMLGELWYAEADMPLGPWVYARKVVTHDRYDIYNPKQHPYFDKDGGRIIFLEGTYTNTFSGNPEATPRYNYNQMMYKLDLADERLVLPVAVYTWEEAGQARYGRRSAALERKDARITFFALNRPRKGAVPVRLDGGQLKFGEAGGADAPLFWALPADMKDAPRTAVPLYEFRKGGQRRYETTATAPAGWKGSDKPLCLVWRNPSTVWLPPGMIVPSRDATQ